MRIQLFILTGCIIVILAGCANPNTKKTADSGTKLTADTLVSTIPRNYLESLDTVAASRKLITTSYKDLLDLFETLNYTPEVWQAGIRKVPRLYITNIGERWGSTTTKEITILYKKRIFFRGLAPLILRANELILADRNRLEKIRSLFQSNNSLSNADNTWIMKLAKLYKVDLDNNQITVSDLDELWKRVDIIPPSLALSQAATESGWGTSRFAAAGNAIYGQWSWGENAMKPEEQRTYLGNYGVAAFESLQESVSAYMLNLNTHRAYSELRDKREQLRKKGEKLTGYVLAEGLIRYSERGESYIHEIQSLMNHNQLNPVDDAYLTDNAPIYLVPATE